VSAGADRDEAVVAADPSPARARQVAAARAAHPSISSPGRRHDECHLTVVKPIRPPTAPEAWSAGLWGSFA